MKNLLKKISEINAKHWGLVLEFNKSKYKKLHAEYMAEMETAIHKYTISNCDCPEMKSAGHVIKSVCNNCGRVEK